MPPTTEIATPSSALRVEPKATQGESATLGGLRLAMTEKKSSKVGCPYYYIALLDFNIKNIYQSKKLTSQRKRIYMILKDLFDLFYEVIKKTRHDKEKGDYYNGGNMYQVFYEFLDDMEYPDDTPDAQVISDFISGMTDNFAIRAFQELLIVSSPA